MHPTNVGRLALGLPGPVACTPAGIEALLAHYEVPVAGRDVVIVGRGVTIGRPLSILLSQKRPTANAAVTVVHTGVADWAEHTRRADILVAAAGVPGMIQPEHVNPGGVVVGAGVQYAGPHAPPRRRRGVRGGRRLDHPPRGRGGAHHDRHALPQLRGGRRAPRRHPVMAGTLTTLPPLDDPRPRVVGTRLAGPPDADHDPARRRAAPGPVGRHGPGGGGRLLRRAGTGVAHTDLAGAGRRRGRCARPRGAGAPRWRRVRRARQRHRRLHAVARQPVGPGAGHRGVAGDAAAGSRRTSGTASWPTAPGSRSPTGAAAAVVLVNCFLFPDEVDRVLAPDGVVVWVNSSGAETPIHLPPDDVVAALPGSLGGRAEHRRRGDRGACCGARPS